MIEHTTFVLAGIALVGIACQWVAWRFKIPAILLLLTAGLVAGPGTGLLRPDDLFGDLLFPVVSLGVAIVLFEGSLTLRLHEIREVAAVVRNLVTVGALITWLVAAAAAHWLVGFGWELSFLFGALVVVTGPTVVVPMLRSIRPTPKITNVLRWEGIIIDPVGALLAVLVFEFIVSGREGDALMVFPMTVASGAGVGLIGALLLGLLLRRHLLPHYLVNVVALALVLSAFALANAIKPEAGLVAVTVMGMVLANLDVPIGEVLDFKESLSVLFISGLFIILAARIELDQLGQLGWPALALLGVIIFMARPLAVAVSAYGSTLDWRERSLIAWIGPRGIVAAAVSAIFALRLEGLGAAGAELLVPLTFLVIMGTVIVQGLTARPLARLLQVAEPEPNGVLIVGAHAFARSLGRHLADEGFRVIMADTHWDSIRSARMAGLATYFGNPVSEHAERHLDLMGIGRLFALSDRAAFNALACVHYRSEFGADRVYAINTPEEKEIAGKAAIARRYACVRLFGEEITLPGVLDMLSEGAEIRTTRLTENFDMEAYRAKYRGRAIPLFAVNEKGCLRVFTAEDNLAPGPDWRIVGLVPAQALEQTEEGTTEQKAESRKAEQSRGAGRGRQ